MNALALALEDLDFDAIVPVPSHWQRKLWRGRDQSREIANFLAKHFQKPVLIALTRIRATATQRGLDKTQRLRNLKQAFALQHSVQNLRLLLVDDVITTGSTVDLASKALLAGKPKSVIVACIAKTPTKFL